jgi:ABC-type sugar transport system substrate-binding protein
MRRRAFITLLGGAAAALPLGTQAQSEKVWRVGVLMAFAESDPEYKQYVATFREELSKLGWSEARLRIDERWPADDMDRVLADAAELINLKPDAILVGGRRALSRSRPIPSPSSSPASPIQSSRVSCRASPDPAVTSQDSPHLSRQWSAKC